MPSDAASPNAPVLSGAIKFKRRLKHTTKVKWAIEETRINHHRSTLSPITFYLPSAYCSRRRISFVCGVACSLELPERFAGLYPVDTARFLLYNMHCIIFSVYLHDLLWSGEKTRRFRARTRVSLPTTTTGSPLGTKQEILTCSNEQAQVWSFCSPRFNLLSFWNRLH